MSKPSQNTTLLILATLVLVLGLAAGNADADTIYVCWDGSGDYSTIQAGIDAAMDGDEVIVCDGTYTGAGNKNLDFHGKAITVRSANGPDNCIIDCEESGRGFHFHSGETDASVLNGLTIKNGTVTGYGGGIRCYYSSPTISNCIVADCCANYLTINYGGGILCDNAGPTITQCTIKGNRAWGYGGGISCVEDSRPIIMNCIITRNRAGYDGGGGGISCDASAPKIFNCTITENAQLGNTIVGGVLVADHSHVTMSNCILWGNVETSSPPIDEIGVISSSFLEVSYCDVAGGEADVYVEDGSMLHWGPGNLDIDPELTRFGNHVLASSPCIDAGDPEFVPQPDEADIDGEDRIVNDRVDMGADEFLDTDADTLPDWWEQRYFGSPTGGDAAADDDGDGLSNSGEYAAARNPFQPSVTYYVNVLGYDGWDGLAPEWDGEHGPKATIQAAIDATDPYEADVVIVAEGTYTGDGNRRIDYLGKVITVRSTDPDDMDVVAATVIDCEGSWPNPQVGFKFLSRERLDSVLAGLTIINASYGGGGGVLCHMFSGPLITQCILADNYDYGAGAIQCYNASRPTVTDCMILGNTSDTDGGGISCFWQSHATISNCMIVGNGSYKGGGIYYSCSNLTITDCLIMDNEADYGGGIYGLSGNAAIANCILWSNTAVFGPQIWGSPSVTYSCVQGGWPGEGNIDADPLFVDPDNGDYRLSAGSPCIDAADNEAVPADELDLDEDGDTEEPIPFDLDGNPRFIDDLDTEDTGNPDPDYPELPVVDMGAYEFQIPGDINGDGCVDQADLGILLADWGCTGGGCPGDCDGDGDTDHADLGILLAHWGQGCP